MPQMTIGLRDLYVAELLTDDETGVTYGAPEKLATAVDATITRNGTTDPQYGDDGPVDVIANVGQIEVEITTLDLSLEKQAFLFGHTINADGVLEKSTNDNPKMIAFGFRSLQSDGAYKYVWLYKGQFAVVDDKYQTKGSDVTPQNVSVKGTFIRRLFDDKYEGQVVSGTDGVDQTVIDNWFKQVYNSTTTQPAG